MQNCEQQSSNEEYNDESPGHGYDNDIGDGWGLEELLQWPPKLMFQPSQHCIRHLLEHRPHRGSVQGWLHDLEKASDLNVQEKSSTVRNRDNGEGRESSDGREGSYSGEGSTVDDANVGADVIAGPKQGGREP